MPQTPASLPANLDEPIISRMADNAKFAPLLAIYHADLIKNLPRLQEALAAGDLPAMQQLAHRLAGTGTSYGYPQITAAARTCEISIREQMPQPEIHRNADAVIRLVKAAIAGAAHK